MHWSKTRHMQYTQCPRCFFYGAVAAQQNQKLASLRDEPAAPLVRHEIVRRAIASVLKGEFQEDPDEIIESTCKDAHAGFLAQFDDYTANRQTPIVEDCLNGFISDVYPGIQGKDSLHLGEGAPAEFEYRGLSMMASVDLAVRDDDVVRVYSWRTGKSAFYKQQEANVKCAAVTFWVRSALGIVGAPVVFSDVFLAEGGLRKDTELDDRLLSEQFDSARRTVGLYTASAKIRDFPASPGQEVCRFCRFKPVCPEYLEYSEPDYSPSALKASRVSDRPAGVASPRRRVFLSHCSEDKDEVVRPFARALDVENISYWIDEAEILWGDSLVKMMNEGLRDSDLVVCFISDAFIGRGWPEAELGSALSLDVSKDGKRILPIAVASVDSVKKEYPLLADRRMVDWADGIPKIVGDLKAVIQRDSGDSEAS